MPDYLDSAVENACYEQLLFCENRKLLDGLLYILDVDDTNKMKHFFGQKTKTIKSDKASADVVIYSSEFDEEMLIGLDGLFCGGADRIMLSPAPL